MTIDPESYINEKGEFPEWVASMQDILFDIIISQALPAEMDTKGVDEDNG